MAALVQRHAGAQPFLARVRWNIGQRLFDIAALRAGIVITLFCACFFLWLPLAPQPFVDALLHNLRRTKDGVQPRVHVVRIVRAIAVADDKNGGGDGLDGGE